MKLEDIREALALDGLEREGESAEARQCPTCGSTDHHAALGGCESCFMEGKRYHYGLDLASDGAADKTAAAVYVAAGPGVDDETREKAMEAFREALATDRAFVVPEGIEVSRIEARGGSSIDDLRGALALDGMEATYDGETEHGPNCATCGKRIRYPFLIISGANYCQGCEPLVDASDHMSIVTGPGSITRGLGVKVAHIEVDGAPYGSWPDEYKPGEGEATPLYVTEIEAAWPPRVPPPKPVYVESLEKLEVGMKAIAGSMSGPARSVATTMRTLKEAMAEALKTHSLAEVDELVEKTMSFPRAILPSKKG